MNLKSRTLTRRQWRMALFAGALVAVSGCSAMVDTRGNMPLAEAIEEIKPGQHSRNQISELLGSPSTTATFEKEEIWYYIGEKTETLAFFSPKIVERKIVVVRFNESGVVSDIQRYSEEDGKPVEIVSRVTPTKGKELGVLEQIIGNVGRFGNPNREE